MSINNRITCIHFEHFQLTNNCKMIRIQIINYANLPYMVN